MKHLFLCLAILALAACAAVPESPEPVTPPAQSDRPPSEVVASEPPPSEQEVQAASPEPEPTPETAEPAPPAEATPERRQPPLSAATVNPEPAAQPDRPVTTDQPRSSPQGQLAGSVMVMRNGRPMAGAATFLNQTVVAWRPDNRSAVSPMDERVITTRRSRFFPQTMAVTSGTSIRFPNRDSIEHNVFSLTPGHQFDVGMYGEGEGVSHRFTGTGVVELFCNIHPNMAAFVLVLDTPFFASPDADGRFDLSGLPEGPGELLVWNYRAEEPFQRMPMTLDGAAEVPEIRVDITRPAVPQHTNKHGEPYRPR